MSTSSPLSLPSLFTASILIFLHTEKISSLTFRMCGVVYGYNMTFTTLYCQPIRDEDKGFTVTDECEVMYNSFKEQPGQFIEICVIV